MNRNEGAEVIRCRNWESEPDICGKTCGVSVPLSALKDNSWTTMVIDSKPEWFIMLRSCTEHGVHLDPYCSLACFVHHHARHDHPGTDD